MDKAVEDFDREWRFIDEGANLKSEPYQEWLDIDKYAEVHRELRLVADEVMRLEYELLKMANCTDKELKYKPPKVPKEKKKRGKGKRNKEESKPFGNRSVETVYDEMVGSGLICDYPKNEMEKYIGDLNYCASELRNIYNKQVLLYFMLNINMISF